MFGGYGGGTGRLDDFYSYTFETGTWEEVQVLSPVKPGCRENNGVVISDASKSIYLFGTQIFPILHMLPLDGNLGSPTTCCCHFCLELL
jgi:hypothetical protein